MALKGLDIFKLTPKSNCKECGQPTCMAFAMKVAQGTAQIEQCPHMSADALAQLSEATAPPMKTVKIGAGEAEYTLGAETVLFRHDKTFVNKTIMGAMVDSADADASIAKLGKVDYERISERMRVELAYIDYTGDEASFVAAAKKAQEAGYALVLGVTDAAAAKAALDAVGTGKPILNAARPDNYEEVGALAKEYGAVLGVSADTLDSLYDTVAALEKQEIKDIVLDLTGASIKEAFANAVQVRRAALKHEDRVFGYPSLVNLAKLAPGDLRMQTALASVFIRRYGSVLIFDEVTYAQALPLYGLRQNIFTDPQKPMTVEQGIYPINGGNADSACVITVDFALTYFIISGEMERSGVASNLLIPDAGGYSVLTAWAAGKFSAGSIAKFVKEEIEGKITNRKLIIPGKVAVLKGELEENLPDWNIVVGPNESVSLVKFLKEMQ